MNEELLAQRVKALEEDMRKPSPKFLYMENRIRELEDTITRIREELIT